MHHQIDILLVEDDELTSELIYNFLTENNFRVSAVFSALESMEHLRRKRYDVILLDINLPDYTGYEVLKSLKGERLTPVIVISAYGDTQSKLLAFQYGAMDYVVKPVDLEELQARIYVQLGRRSQITSIVDPVDFEIKGMRVFYKNVPLDLTATEFEIMRILLENTDRVVRREELSDALSSMSSQRSLDNHIKNIRKKINRIDPNARHLKTEYGVGYYLDIR